MGALSLPDQRLKNHDHHQITEEIEGLIRVYADGHVDRMPVMPHVPCMASKADVVHCRDAPIDNRTRVWARVYAPADRREQKPLPLLVYFHGGGFCVGSASWACYHEFLARLSSVVGCVVVSVNYRLAPEHRLPAAFDDGVTALKWVRQGGSSDESWWRSRCDFTRVFVGGDSAGACVAYNAHARHGAVPYLKGLVLIQPFFGGEARTPSEKCYAHQPKSALKLSASDAYWRLALPAGASRDHPWCNPLAKVAAAGLKRVPAVFVAVAELDVLRDRNVEFCNAMRQAGVAVTQVVSAGVGHAFQVLHSSQLSELRTHELVLHVKDFIMNK
ncbi:putative carboxylesterase 17 [Acorus calamus]|uniref:Carboxylesterase 17 n=1 Tax=Acorus calamus TaxID=4465 RepID=A0AAV9DM89_ACOCL|nr:putative carboxylesterase 17 [Acorus calamus]